VCLETLLEIEMKKLIPITLIAVLSGVQLVSVAQPAHVHEHQATQETGAVDMHAMREDMQKKMAAAKTGAERQQLMAEQQKKMQGMQGMHGQMHAQMGSHDHGAMKGMPGGDADMQKRMQSMRDQMTK
jgi:hypothetical protein